MGGIIGGGAVKSKYLMTGSSHGGSDKLKWIVSGSADLGPLKSENFKPKTAIGKGKFGAVFMAENMKTKQHVAIKYVSYEMIFSGKHADRVDQEIKVLKAVSHPFIVHYFGSYRTPGSIAMVFEMVMGGELYMRMKKQHKMAEIEAKFYACEMAMALEYLHHTAGMVYRDLKPENVLIDHQGHVKLCDFGFACPLNSFSTLSDGCGTIMYLAPEIASGYKNASHGFPVDWWSLGCIVYEIVTGEPPFGDTDGQSKFAILNRINGSVVRYPMSMSSELKEVLTGLLNKEPSSRWQWQNFHRSAWVNGVNWENLEAKKIGPPWKPPSVSDQPDLSNFLSWGGLEAPISAASREAVSYCTDNIVVPTGPSLRSMCESNSENSKFASSSGSYKPPSAAAANRGATIMDDIKSSAKSRADSHTKSDHTPTPTVGSGGHTPTSTSHTGGGNGHSSDNNGGNKNDHKKLKNKATRSSFGTDGNRSAASSVPNSHPNSARGQQTNKIDINQAFGTDHDVDGGIDASSRSDQRKAVQQKRGSHDKGSIKKQGDQSKKYHGKS